MRANVSLGATCVALITVHSKSVATLPCSHIFHQNTETSGGSEYFGVASCGVLCDKECFSDLVRPRAFTLWCSQAIEF